MCVAAPNAVWGWVLDYRTIFVKGPKNLPINLTRTPNVVSSHKTLDRPSHFWYNDIRNRRKSHGIKWGVDSALLMHLAGDV